VREYQRLLGSETSLTSGQYTRAGGATTISCKRCGERSAMTLPVLPGGRVIGAWLCQRCPERDFLTLCDYDLEVIE
jgi:hypothetical protein